MIVFIVFLISTLLFGCSDGPRSTSKTASVPEKSRAVVYYLNLEHNGIEMENRVGRADTQGLLELLSSQPEDARQTALLGTETELNDWHLKDGQLLLDFSSSYLDLSKTDEVLFRASVVQTLLQDESVNLISFSVDGEELKLSNGQPIGAMNESTFIFNAGDEINSYEKSSIRLYFATPDGASLTTVDETVVYSRNLSRERLVLDKLIEGPIYEGAGPTLPPDTKVNSINVRNGICYISLDSGLEERVYDVTEEVVLYSIVNSMCELPSINRVQLSVNGNTDRALRSQYQLSEMYTRNLDIVRQPQVVHFLIIRAYFTGHNAPFLYLRLIM